MRDHDSGLFASVAVRCAGTVVSAVHAGWRGLCDGALEASIHAVCRAAKIESNQLMAWLGPAIGPNAFEVGAEVRAQFMAIDSKAEVAFKPHGDKWLGDIIQNRHAALE